MSIFKRNTSYGVNSSEPAVLSPYDRAKCEWDNRIGSARVQAFHWRITAILSLVAVLGLTVGLVHVSANKEVKTYIVEVDHLGLPARIVLADGSYQPNQAVAGYFVGQLVKLVRARSLDPVVVRDNWTTAYGYLAGDAVNTMNAYAIADPPLRAIEGRPLARTVAISNVLQKSRRSYQVRWVETDYIGGAPQRPEQHTGVFEIDLMTPRDEAEVFRNPLGIYVVSFNWSKEFTEPVVNPVESTLPTNTPTHQETVNESNH